MAGALSTYAFINAKLRARISKLIDEETFRRIARAGSFLEAMGLLSDTRYGAAAAVYNTTGDVRLAELEFVRAQWAALGDLGRYTPESILPFTRAVFAEFEIALLKHALRLWFEHSVRGRPIDDKVAYLIRDHPNVSLPLDDIINAGSPDDIITVLGERPYRDVLAGRLDGVGEAGSLFSVEVALDRWYHGQLLEAAGGQTGRDSEVAMRLLGIQIDIRNVNWIVRMKRYYELDQSEIAESLISGGALFPIERLQAVYGTESPIDPLLGEIGARYSALLSGGANDESRGVAKLAMLEELLRSVLFQEIRRTLGGYPFTIGTILAYFLLVQNEVRLLTSVFNAKYYELAPERIEELI